MFECLQLIQEIQGTQEFKKFKDFKIHVEFKYPKESNSGLYLRGRYEVQIADNIGTPPSSIYFGGVYGLLTPNENVAMKAGEWQSYDITLIGRRVTIEANGKTIIDGQNIAGMTGGALDNHEAEPGPIMLQGDHGPGCLRVRHPSHSSENRRVGGSHAAVGLVRG